MALKQGSSGGKGKTFLRIDGRDGIFVESVKNDATGKWDSVPAAPSSVLTGSLIKLATRDDVNKDGKAIVKLVMEFADPDPHGKNMVVEAALWRQSAKSDNPEVGTTSRFALGILAGLNAADLTKPIDLMPWAMKAGDEMPDGTPRTSDGAGVSFRQGGVKLKPAFVEKGQVVERLAPLPSQVFNGETFYDKSGWNDVASDTFKAVLEKLHPSEAENMADHDEDAIDPSQAAMAARDEAPRARA